MKDIKQIIAKNISELRQSAGITQLELAEKINYSDKAVSKWERGESIPDVTVLLELSHIFDVSIDYLVSEEHRKEDAPISEKRTATFTYSIITAVSVVFVWFVAVLIFVICSLVLKDSAQVWLSFVCAIPFSALVWLVLNSIWFDKNRNYLIISIIIWSVLLVLHLFLLPFSHNMWLIYMVGVLAQIIVILWWLWSVKIKPKRK